MAKARALDRRRKSIRSIRKITRTMELISTAHLPQGHGPRRGGLGLYEADHRPRRPPYHCRAGVQTSAAGGPSRDVEGRAARALRQSRPLRRIQLQHLSARTGQWKQLQAAVPEVRLEVSGKRGISAFRFRKFDIAERFTQFDDKPTFAEVEVLANRYLDWYQSGRLDRLDIIYTKFESLGRQFAVVETLLPLAQLGGEAENHDGGQTQYEFLPSAASIVDEVVPVSFKVKLFKCFLDAAVSEQIARRVAMKNATENAESMIGSLSIAYNRARQGQITGELLEIIGGAEALNK